MQILVLGGGVVGVTSAWFLQQAGHQVTLVDRQPAPAQEASFANGGQISVSHPEPWANPSAPGTILRWLGRDDAPLLWHWRKDWSQWRWGAAFLRQCLPGATKKNTEAIAHLAVYSLSVLRALRAQIALDYDASTRGILHLFNTAETWALAQQRVSELGAYGIDVAACDREACFRIEPALEAHAKALQGGVYAKDDESGDAQLFAKTLSEQCVATGVRFIWNTEVIRLEQRGRRVSGVVVKNDSGQHSLLEADATVLCLGSYSPLLMRPLGEYLPIYPVKGYSVTVPVTDESRAPRLSLTDEARRIVCSRLGSRLRVAGTAEVNGYDLSPNEARSQSLLDWLAHYFSGGFDADKAEHWNGLRSMMPTGVPLIGASPFPGLFYNTGQGSLGWTLACGSGAALAQLVADERPSVDFPFLYSAQ